MSKKHFILLAEYIRAMNRSPDALTDAQIDQLADFCKSVNPRFNRERWIGFINGENGPCGGRTSKKPV